MGRNKRYYIEYATAFTLAFVLLFYVCYAVWFYKANKTFFRSFDGLDQHYVIFVYIGNLLRDFFYNLFVNHDIIIPMWNMGIGYGSDIPTSLAAYLPDPFNWISVFFPGVRSQFGYCVMIVMKVYAAGVAFSYFCFYHKQGRLATLIGALTYMFSGTMYLVFVESFVINPMYIFPFVLVGVDQLWKTGKSHVYVFSLVFAFVNYVYFAYMICIFVLFYALLLFAFETKDHKRFSYLLREVRQFFIYSVLAAGISMVVVLPNVLVLVQESRLDVHYYLPLLFDKTYYIGLLTGFTDFYSLLERDCLMGYGSLSLLSVLLIFTKRGQFKKEKICFIGLTLMLCIPLAGSFMNGFSYTSSRWIWAYALCVAYIVTLMVPQWSAITNRQRKIILAAVFVYMAFISLANPFTTILRNTLLIIPVVTIGVLSIGKIPGKYRKYLLMGICCLALFVPAMNHFYFRSGKDNLFGMSYEVPRGYAYKAVRGFELAPVMDGIAQEGLQNRYDWYGLGLVKNMSWLYGVSGMDFYISMYNNHINTFHNDLALSTDAVPFSYRGLDRRSELLHLMNVQHFLINKRISDSVPYGFSDVKAEQKRGKETVLLYGTPYENSLVHGFDTVLPLSAFKQLTPYERQDALMKAVFVEGEFGKNDVGAFRRSSLDEVTYSSYCDKGLLYQDGIVETTQKDGNLHLTFPAVQDSEVYLYVEGVAENDINDGVGFRVEGVSQGKSLPSTVFYRYTPTNRTHMYGGKHSWLLNMGIVKNMDEVVLTFPKEGTSTLKGISLYAKPIEAIKKNIEGLHSIGEDVKIKNNELTFHLKDDSYPYMLISIPYSTGWKAYVDGSERTIHLADDAFMALPVQKGDHEVKIIYRTPGLLEGLVISLVSIGVYGVVCLRRKHG